MRLPGGAAAILDVRKLEDYCLSPTHLRGRYKARVFREALGLGPADAAWLRRALLDGARDAGAVQIAADAFGTRWRVDVKLARQDRSAVVRSIWIVRTGEDVPRFVTCWVL